MRKFWIVKDGTGGKLFIQEPYNGETKEKYLTNDELKGLYNALGELPINQDQSEDETIFEEDTSYLREAYNKELIVRDLFARLPYSVLIKDDNGDYIEVNISNVNLEHLIDRVREGLDKLVLRPISSMTDSEKQELFRGFNDKYAIISSYCIDCNDSIWMKPRSEPMGFPSVTYESMRDVIHWFYKNGFDINDLIPKGLAVDYNEYIYGKQK